ncbi:unnamed protein product [Adineta ricciae]|uniref:LIM interaction domain-containing protein n=1 Tax=Adineta ricciae TaxID=249248 RepID=A0A815VE38_ADIRI|nr:unnamed protein product [Adineta ricciae]CAF1528958.1 unnamed protein product [Adineta ricciae]
MTEIYSVFIGWCLFTVLTKLSRELRKFFYYTDILVAKNRNRSKVDPSGFQPGLVDSSGAGGVWQGPPPPGSQPPTPIQQPPSHLIHPPPPPLHHHPGRIPIMPPRDLHFPPQHMRQFRPVLPPPPPPSPEYRMHDLNKRLSMRPEESDSQWWDAFVNEFFEDDAILTISICLEDGPKRFSIGRVLIPRFFRTLFDGGVSEVYFQLKQTKEMFHSPILSLDCEQASMITCFGKPPHIKVCTEGHLTLEYAFDDLMRIKSWHFAIKQFRELIPRSIVAIPADNPTYLDQLSKNLTRSGLTSVMLNFLRLCEILEPMQELMSRHKTTSFSPRDCLKTILHQRWSKTCSELPQSPSFQTTLPSQTVLASDTRPPAKPRRKRKSTATNNPATPGNNNSNNISTPKDGNMNNCTMPTPTKKRSPANTVYSEGAITPSMNSMPGDVMIVGEPSLMGGEMDDEDERYITRLENTQYDPNAAASSHPPPQYLSPTHQMPPGFSSQQQSPNLQSLLHQKQQQFVPNSPLLHPNQMKREQTSFPGSPQPQQQQPLPSMFSAGGPPTPNTNAFPPPSTPINGDVANGGKRNTTASNVPVSGNTSSTTTNNSSGSPPTPSSTNHNQNPSTPATSTNNPPTTPTNSTWNGPPTNITNSSTSSTNPGIAEKKQEPHTPPATPQQTIATAS